MTSTSAGISGINTAVSILRFLFKVTLRGSDVTGQMPFTPAQGIVEKVTNLPLEKIIIHNHLIGGGFGRRLKVDGIEKAARVAQKVIDGSEHWLIVIGSQQMRTICLLNTRSIRNRPGNRTTAQSAFWRPSVRASTEG
jgi:hypothetical protein